MTSPSQPFHLKCSACKAVNYVTFDQLGWKAGCEIHVLTCLACKADTFFGADVLPRFEIKKDAP